MKIFIWIVKRGARADGADLLRVGSIQATCGKEGMSDRKELPCKHFHIVRSSETSWYRDIPNGT